MLKTQTIAGFGVARIVDSGSPNFKVGDLVWGTTGWEEYSLITKTEDLKKIEHTDVPLSYFLGILDMSIDWTLYLFVSRRIVMQIVLSMPRRERSLKKNEMKSSID